MFWLPSTTVLVLSPVIAGNSRQNNKCIRSSAPRNNEFIRSFPARSNEFIRSLTSSAKETPVTNKFVTTWEETDHKQPEYAPIVESKLDFYDFNYSTVEAGSFDLRDYLKGKQLIIIEYFAGWCENSNRNGHVIQRLWSKYRDHGLGVVGVAEYSDAAELRIHINRIGIDYPIVVETTKLGKRKDSSHYRYRHAVGDKRKWGTPFYVIIDARDVEPSGNNRLIARRVYTASGELEEESTEQFLRKALTKSGSEVKDSLARARKSKLAKARPRQRATVCSARRVRDPLGKGSSSARARTAGASV